MAARIWFFGALLAVATAFLGVVLAFGGSGCALHSCEGTFEPDGGTGRMIDDDTWESNAIDEDWIPFPASRSYRFHIPAWYPDGRIPVSVEAYVSVDKRPDTFGQSSWVLASGNIVQLADVEFPPWSPDSGLPEPAGPYVQNGTCADYYLRLVIRGARPRPAPAVDAGAPDAPEDGPSDAASSDAPVDSGQRD